MSYAGNLVRKSRWHFR